MSIASISVVVPVFNSVATMYETFDSIKQQSLQPLEVVVVDDGSTDDTHDLVATYIEKNRLSNWRLLKQSNAGPGLARHNGISVASAPFIALLDADDTWAKDKLLESYEFLVKYKLDVVGSGVSKFPICSNFFLVNKYFFLLKNIYFTSTVLFSKEAYIHVGGFDCARRYSEDYKLWLYFLFRDMRCGFLNVNSTYYRQLLQRGHVGLSSKKWKMFVAELHNFNSLRRDKLIGPIAFLVASTFSALKFIKRLI